MQREFVRLLLRQITEEQIADHVRVVACCLNDHVSLFWLLICRWICFDIWYRSEINRTFRYRSFADRTDYAGGV